MMIYKILPRTEWEQAQATGQFTGSVVDIQDGYIHFSTAEQVAETAAKHFAGRTDLVLLEIDENSLGEHLRWEPSRGGALFPHLYGSLQVGDVAIVEEMRLDDSGSHIFAERIVSAQHKTSQ